MLLLTCNKNNLDFVLSNKTFLFYYIFMQYTDWYCLDGFSSVVFYYFLMKSKHLKCIFLFYFN